MFYVSSFMTIVDLKTEQRKNNYSLVSDELLSAIEPSLQNKQKVVLFHNRKEYARRIFCADCRSMIICLSWGIPGISAEHNHGYDAFCSSCNERNTVTACRKCKGTRLKPRGFGIPKLKE